MMRFLTPAALAIVLIGTAPVFAASCNDVGGGPNIGFDFQIGGAFSEDDADEFAMMQLKAKGVDAVRVERWGGCFRAFVRHPGGGTKMEYFNARTLEPVD